MDKRPKSSERRLQRKDGKMKFVACSVLALFLLCAFASWREARADKDWKTMLEKRTFTDKDGKTLPYRLLKPDNYDPNQKYPLVLFLHGAGERGKDNEKQLIHGVAEFAKAENRKKY